MYTSVHVHIFRLSRHASANISLARLQTHTRIHTQLNKWAQVCIADTQHTHTHKNTYTCVCVTKMAQVAGSGEWKIQLPSSFINLWKLKPPVTCQPKAMRVSVGFRCVQKYEIWRGAFTIASIWLRGGGRRARYKANIAWQKERKERKTAVKWSKLAAWQLKAGMKS